MTASESDGSSKPRVNRAPYLRRVHLAEPSAEPEEPVEDPKQDSAEGDDWDPDDFPAWYRDRVDEGEDDADADLDKEDGGADQEAEAADYPAGLAAVDTIEWIEFGAVTVLTGDNGTGKSTIVEAIAVAAGFNAEGGSRNLQFATQDTHSSLADELVLEWERTPRWGWFLRAESFYGMATHIEADPYLVDTFPRFHHRSHGESFLDLAAARFTGAGLYILDEPESALSIQGLIALASVMSDSLAKGSQFIVSTHSPFLMAFPGARLYNLDRDSGVTEAAFEDLDSVSLWRRLLADPASFYRRLEA